MHCVCASSQDASVGLNRLCVGFVNLNNPRGLIHVEGKGHDSAITARLHSSRGGRDVINSFIAFAAVNVCGREMFSSDRGQFASDRNFPDGLLGN
eukprot:1885128-Heterocapsa_arctica.AAC.1